MQKDHSGHRTSAQVYPLCYLAVDMRTPTNVGSLFRVADALGAERIYLTGKSIVPPNSKLRKTSRSTEKQVAFEYVKDALETAIELRNRGYRIICLEITSSSIDLEQLPVNHEDRVCLVLGSEKDGIPQGLLDIADAAVHIPMLGHNSSMNVTVACAIATYEITRKLPLARTTLN